ncbi:hypothetical protein [Lentzea sp. NPDC004782]|uniref:hypothetical protein n=1 Tax=Lentzea sp. NPDC004782 TaxID=3154458 RepID=UPI0033A6CEA4
MLHITLAAKTPADDPTDPLQRTFYGWGEGDPVEQNWANNRGCWVLGARANRENYVIFSYYKVHKVVMAAEIDQIIDAPGRPGRKIIEGRLLSAGHPVHDRYVGESTPPSARARNPVTYFDSTVGGRLCGCGCGTEIFVGDFVRGHEQTALHQRVAKIGTIPDFLRWFDAVHAGLTPTAASSEGASLTFEGSVNLTVADDGSATITVKPTPRT